MNKDIAFVFDFDGTIAETIPLAIESFFKTLNSYELPIPSITELKKYFGPCELGVLKNFSSEFSDDLFKSYLNYYKDLHKEFAPNPYDRIDNILKNIKSKSYRLGLITGKSAQSLAISLNEYNLNGIFDVMHAGSSTGSVKPEKMRMVCEEWNMNPSKIYYIGDSPSDITESKEAGLIPIAVSWSSIVSADALTALSPYKHFDKVADFEAWIESVI